MRDIVTITSRMLALACGAVFVILAAFTLLFWNADRLAFNPQAVKRLLLEQKVYDRLPSLIAEQLSVSLSRAPAGPQNGLPVFFNNLKQQDWEIILSGLLTPQWLQSQTEGAIDQGFAYLDSAEPDPSIKISLAELKVRFQGEPGLRAFLTMLKAQPDCTAQQLMEIAQAAFNGSLENIPICNPPEELLGQFRPEIQAGLNQVGAMLPAEIDLGTQLRASSAGASAIDPRPPLRTARLLVRLSPLLLAGLLFLVTIFAVRSLRDWLLWWGVLFGLSGLAALVLGGLAGAVLSQAFSSALSPGGSAGAGWVQGLAQVVGDFGQALAAAVVRSTLVQAVVIAFIGSGMLVLGLLVRPRVR